MPLSSLNTEQSAAAAAPAGANLIIASAGTGKTSTIVGRIAYLLEQGMTPERILLLTFTNKAAGEMIARLGARFPRKAIEKIESGTFHAVAYRWLKSRIPGLSLKQPGELKTLFRSIYEKRQFRRLNLEIEPFAATYLYDLYSLYQNASLERFDRWLLERYPEHEPLMDIYLDICEAFEQTKREYGFVSFNDLLLLTRNYLQENRIDFGEVLVDEYQDTNTLQGALIDALKPDSLFCVGDYDQSIYAFNGANIANIATFTERYPGARVFTLSTNYRSTASILSLANRVIERNERIYPKRFRAGRAAEKSAPPRLLLYDELFEQYQSIAAMIRQSRTSKDHIAVIFRNNASADGIEASLRELGVPCRRKGGTSFFESREIKFLLDLMSLLVNPRDMMAFIHVFEYGKGIGAALAKEIFQSLIHFGQGDLLEGLLRPRVFDLPKLNPNKNLQLGLFDDDLEVGSVSRFSHMNLPEAIRAHPILKHPGLGQDGVRFFTDFYRFVSSAVRANAPKTILRHAVDSPLYQTVVDQLSTQRARLKSGEVDPDKKKHARERIEQKARLLLDLSRHYRELERFVNAMVLGGNELSEGEGVHLLTVHASKGLEFTDVYIVDLMDGRFPNHKLMGGAGGIDEERRLFYVAVTRARDRLFLSLARYDRIKKLDFKPSPFLYEAGLIKAPASQD